MAGHMDAKKTLWRVAARFWWPNQARDVHAFTKSCAHCRVANLTSHQAREQLKSVQARSPFEIMAFDIWKPGDLPSSLASKRSKLATCVLVGMDVMTGFAMCAVLTDTSSAEVARVLFHHFIAVTGLPSLILLDDGSEFKGTLENVCGAVGINRWTVLKENHKAILPERFNRYLNKVQRLHVADCETIDDWLIGVTFATYAWNSAPVDGTDITRSFAAMGREFPFPIDKSLDEVTFSEASNHGEMAIAHIEGTFPLLFKQRDVL